MSAGLTTTYLGLQLDSPVIVGSCPLTMEPEAVRQMADCGAGAIVFPSIMQEQIEHLNLLKTDPPSAVDRTGNQPQHEKYNGGPENYLVRIQDLQSHTNIPIIASMSGATVGDWIGFANRIEASGADAIELNVPPVVHDPSRSSEQIESELCEFVQKVCGSVSIPVAVKLTGRFTNLARITRELRTYGADGVVVFAHQPQWDVCLDRLHWTLRWTLTPIESIGATLEGIVRARAGSLDLSIAASGGIRTSEDAIKTLIAGADAVMVTSEIYRDGPGVIRSIVDGISRYIEYSPYDSIASLRQTLPPMELGPDRFKRLEYLDPLIHGETHGDPTSAFAEGSASASGDRFGHRA
jgi:dihydroorotate dehydrogenase (fumarate)